MVTPLSEVQKQLQQYKIQNELLKRVKVSDEERNEYEQLVDANQPLPDGVFKRSPDYTLDKDLFFRVVRPELPKELDIIEQLLFNQSKQIKTLKHLVDFLYIPFILFAIFVLVLLYSYL